MRPRLVIPLSGTHTDLAPVVDMQRVVEGLFLGSGVGAHTMHSETHQRAGITHVLTLGGMLLHMMGVCVGDEDDSSGDEWEELEWSRVPGPWPSGGGVMTREPVICGDNYTDNFARMVVMSVDEFPSGGGMPQYFGTCISFIDEARRGGGSCLVHCSNGKSKSSTICAAYLVRKVKDAHINTLILMCS